MSEIMKLKKDIEGCQIEIINKEREIKAIRRPGYKRPNLYGGFELTEPSEEDKKELIKGAEEIIKGSKDLKLATEEKISRLEAEIDSGKKSELAEILVKLDDQEGTFQNDFVLIKKKFSDVRSTGSFLDKLKNVEEILTKRNLSTKASVLKTIKNTSGLANQFHNHGLGD